MKVQLQSNKNKVHYILLFIKKFNFLYKYMRNFLLFKRYGPTQTFRNDLIRREIK